MYELQTVEAFVLAMGALGLGIVALIRGGGWTVDFSVYIARKVGISPLLVGFTIVAFGTSFPELIVSINAQFHELPGIAMGNVLGSNIANVLLVIGITAIYAPLIATSKAIRKDLIAMMVATFFLLFMMMYGVIGHFTGIGMLAALVLYTVWQYRMAIKSGHQPDETQEPEMASMKQALMFLLFGLLAIAVGAEFLVRGAKVSATIIGVPEDVIALSVIALGTSLPELSTCLIAASKRQSDLVLGNIVGSNFFNIMMILGLTAAVKPMVMADMAPQLLSLDIWIVLGVSLLFTLILLFYKKVGKVIGSIFVMGYVAYIITIYALYLT